MRDWRDAFDDDPQRWGNYDKGLAFSGFLSCSINPPMGMMTRRKSPVIVGLDASVAALPGVVFIGRWSSFGDVLPEAALAQTGVEWFDKMFLNPVASRASPHPGEFLVPRHIPLSNVRRMVFFSEADHQRATDSLRESQVAEGAPPIPHSINPALFGRKMQEEEG